MFNITLPTCNRPAMLRTALTSITTQTRVDLVSHIVVSENGGNRASEDVCREFSALPIEYIYRDPQVSTLEHMNILVTDHLQDELTVHLHDDDWWAPQTLENAARGLARHPDAVCYVAAYYNVAGESAVLTHSGSPLFWFGAGFPDLADFWELSPLAVTLASLIHTPAIFPAMFIRTNVLREAGNVFGLGNDYDVDRMLAARLAQMGTLVFHPFPDVLRRNHPTQDSLRFSHERAARLMSRTTDWILAGSRISKEELLAAFNDRLKRCPDHARMKVGEYLFCSWCIPHLKTTLGPIEIDKSWPNPRNTGGSPGLLPRIIREITGKKR
ncbi:glycosyltransferase [Prosthecobacter sp.]|uniref:glycosyltransferase n=1 Tax=Prosthecobacter sp. TaxID=1965333 RepID=UPI002489DCFD|nr:glycosyltransferase [Prosthecobacter sp.]MDI1311673.1 glycosyltransferase [Prosthecobacter sp.]